MLRALTAIAGPVFAKEMIEIARRKRYYLNRALYGLAILFTLFLVWENLVQQVGYLGIRAMASIATETFQNVSVLQFFAIFIAVPLFLCGTVASEREEGTLELLFTTGLRDREIIVGKLLSRIVVLVLLILCGLPIMSLTMFFGGVDPGSLWCMVGVTFLATYYAGAHAIYFSSVTRSPMGALVRTYWWMGLYLFLIPVALIILLEVISRPNAMWLIWATMGTLLFINPLGPFVILLEGTAYDQLAARLGEWFYPFTFVVPTAWSTFLIWRATVRLRLGPTALAQVANRIGFIRAVRDWAHRRSVARELRNRPRAEKLWRVMPVHNPLWLRARLTKVYDREGHLGRVQLAGWVVTIGFLVLIGLVSRLDLGSAPTQTAFLLMTWLGVAGLTTIVAGSSLVGDRRRGFLDLVLMTPLEPRQVIDGAILAIWTHLRRAYWLPWSLTLLFLFVWFCQATGWMEYHSYRTISQPAGLICSVTSATLFGAVLLVQGVACSLMAKSLPGALVPTVLFPVIMMVGTALFAGFFGEIANTLLWIVTPIALGVAWFWVRWRLSAGSVGMYFLAAHLTMLVLATCWVPEFTRESRLMLINPAAIAIVPLERDMERSFRGGVYWQWVMASYWGALIVNFIWARWWLIRNFERMVERTGAPRTHPIPWLIGLAGSLIRRNRNAMASPPLEAPLAERAG